MTEPEQAAFDFGGYFIDPAGDYVVGGEYEEFRFRSPVWAAKWAKALQGKNELQGRGEGGK